MHPNEARILGTTDLVAATEVLSKAFLRDPLWVYLYTDERARVRYLERFFRALLVYAIDKKLVYGIGLPVVAVAVWDVPGSTTANISLRAILPMLKLLFSPFLFRALSVSTVFRGFQNLQIKYAPPIHYKLETIGVHPDHQGNGYAADLIRPFISKARETNTALYTETVTPANVAFYERYGFEVMEKVLLPKSNLELWSFLLE